MLVKHHILVGLIVSLLIWFVFPQIGGFYTSIIFLSSFLIDFDHYLWYALKKKDLNLKRSIAFFHEKRDFFIKMKPKDRAKYKNVIMIFHGLECWIVLGLLIFVHKIFLFVLVGIGIHMVLDFIDLCYYDRPLHTKLSQVYTHIKNKRLKSLI